MSLPNTPLLVAPSSLENTFGTGFHHTEIIKGLRRCNVNLCIPDPTTWVGWYPGRDFGMTSIWDGEPQQAGVRKVASFHLGIVPEFTQTSPAGIVRKGWRQIFEKLISMRLVTRAALEREFKVTLTYSGKDKVCRLCQMDGELVKVDTASGLCGAHEDARKNKLLRDEHRKEDKWRQSKSLPLTETLSPKTRVYVSKQS